MFDDYPKTKLNSTLVYLDKLWTRSKQYLALNASELKSLLDQEHARNSKLIRNRRLQIPGG